MNKKIIVLLIFTAVLFPAISENRPFIINEIIYNIEGQTTEKALMKYIDLRTGDDFQTFEKMEIKVSEEIQSLLNLRLFQEGTYNLQKIADSSYTLTINLIDGWKIYPIPYPKYDSNKGFRLGMEFYYFNVAGSLLNFFVEGAVDFKLENGLITTGDWKINPSVNNIKIGDFIFSAEIFQSFSNNKKIENYDLQSDYDVYQTDLIVSSKMEIPGLNLFFYTLSPEFKIAYGFTDYLSTAQYIPFRFNWNHSFTYEHLDWQGFQRSGFTGKLGHSLGFSSVDDYIRLNTSISTEVLFFYIWRKINPSIHFYTMKSWNEEIENLGEYMRGILDAHMFGEEAMFLNLGLQFPLIDIKDKFELHMHPFIDIGTTFSEEPRISGGSDLIFFADQFSSLQFRLSYGVDILSLLSEEPNMYELEISSSLAY